jgi:hypothetical protein
MAHVDPRLPPLRPRTVVAWSVVLASTFGLASVFHAVVGSALGGPVATAPPQVQRSPATAALADGDDVRARVLLVKPEQARDITPPP